MTTEKKSDFALFSQKMGHNEKQVTKTGELIGMGSRTANSCNRDERELTRTERLAMSAARAGLPAWTPDTDEQIAEISQKLEGLKLLFKI